MRKFLKSVLKKFAPPMQHRSFFLQGQMDIHPNSRWHDADFHGRHGGFFVPNDDTERRIAQLDAWDNVRRDMLVLFLRSIVANQVEGAMAELGVYRGLTAHLIHHYLPEKPLHLFDTFEGFTERGAAGKKATTAVSVADHKFARTSVEGVRRFVSPRNDHVIFHPGYFPDTVGETLQAMRFAFVHLDADLYEPTRDGLEFFTPRLSEGGILVVHDYNAWHGARRAVDEFCAEGPHCALPLPDKSGSAVLVAGAPVARDEECGER